MLPVDLLGLMLNLFSKLNIQGKNGTLVILYRIPKHCLALMNRFL